MFFEALHQLPLPTLDALAKFGDVIGTDTTLRECRPVQHGEEREEASQRHCCRGNHESLAQ
jgi:hypothetical protein